MIASYAGDQYGICVEIFSGKDMLLEIFAMTQRKQER